MRSFSLLVWILRLVRGFFRKNLLRDGADQGRPSGFGLVLSHVYRITPYLWELVSMPKARSTVLKVSPVSELVQLPR